LKTRCAAGRGFWGGGGAEEEVPAGKKKKKKKRGLGDHGVGWATICKRICPLDTPGKGGEREFKAKKKGIGRG